MTIIGEIVVLLVLFAFSAFFSGSEAAFFSLKDVTVRQWRQNGKPAQRQIARLMDRPIQLLITILLGNMIVNTTSTTVFTRFLQHLNLDASLGIPIATGIMTVLILLFGEITPKLLSVNNNEAIAKTAVYPLAALSILFWPAKVVLKGFTDFILNILLGKNHADAKKISSEQLMSAVEVTAESGAIDTDERQMFKKVIRSFNTPITAIMVPRNQVFKLNARRGAAEIISQVVQSEYRRVPIYKDTLDNIVGVVNKKDLLQYRFGKAKKPKTLKPILRPIAFVPETMSISDTLAQFQSERCDIAIVMDEYSGFQGIVTIEDILAEIMGEFKERESIDRPYMKIGRRRWLVRGDMRVEEFNEVFKEHFKPRDADTMSGFLIECFGNIPNVGEKIVLHRKTFKVNRINANRIDKLTVDL